LLCLLFVFIFLCVEDLNFKIGEWEHSHRFYSTHFCDYTGA